MRTYKIRFVSLSLVSGLVRFLKPAVFATLSLILLQCNPSETIAVENLRIIISPGSAQAMYATIRNETPEALTLTKVESPAFAKIEVHKMIHSENRMRMEKVENLTIPAHSSFNFAPHQFHFMVFDPTEPLVAQKTVPITIYLNDKPYLMNALIKDSED
ncbi:MAG: copper chaperone PCu(A)C [Leptonema sp. (in: Bacteria)]|nr:copper chaperone PCu(A)C [Leptonema sp. (in: bacteria)]